jgi:glutamate 5-kinase
MRNIDAKTIAVKVGTNTLTAENGKLDRQVMENIVNQIAEAKKRGKNVILITSGAIGCGMQELGLKEKPKDVVMKQVCAGVGQSVLMANYNSMFGKHGIKVAQILLSYKDLADAKTKKNLMNSLGKMLSIGIVPIINENDPISIDEIGASFGDNDNLSAMITETAGADLLVMLTNVDGLYDRNPQDKGARLISEVSDITKDIEAMGGGAASLGLGGMKTKIAAAKSATSNGASVVIANGKKKNSLTGILGNDEIGTVFHPKK